MDADVKKRWVEALRSGKYAQAQGELRNKDGHCCLGVLCDLVGPEEWVCSELNCYSFREETAELPSDLALQTDLSRGEQNRLIALNDSGSGFGIIADYIEANL